MDMINRITDKPDWQKKVFDEEIVAKWRTEFLGAGPSLEDGPERDAMAEVEMKVDDTAQSEGEQVETNGNDSEDSAESDEEEKEHAKTTSHITPKMVDWAIAEARYKADIFKQAKCIEALDGVWKSDSVIPDKLKLQLQEAVKPLENVPDVSHETQSGGK